MGEALGAGTTPTAVWTWASIAFLFCKVEPLKAETVSGERKSPGRQRVVQLSIC